MHETNETTKGAAGDTAILCGEMYAGYAGEEAIRSVAASGGIVSALLIDLLERGKIQGALVSRLGEKDGKIAALTTMVQDRAGVLAHAGSAYVDTAVLPCVKALHAFDGKAAIVALPCQARAIRTMLDKDPALREKVYATISLVCRGTVDLDFYHDFLKKQGMDESEVEGIKVERHHIKGKVIFRRKAPANDITIPFFTLNAYRLAGIHAKKRCYWCDEHLGAAADIVVGDLYCRDYKNRPIKHSALAAYTDRGIEILEEARRSKTLVCEFMGMNVYHKTFHRIERFSNDIVSRSWASRLQGMPPLHKTAGFPNVFRCLAWALYLANFRLSRSVTGRRVLYALPSAAVKAMALAIKALSRL